MPRKKAIESKEIKKEKVKILEPAENVHLVEAQEKLVDIETIIALTGKWGITRLSTAMTLESQLKDEINKLSKLN